MDPIENTPETAPDWGALRRLFPATRELAYLNTAGYGPAAAPVLEEVQEQLEGWSSGTGSWRAWEARAEEARDVFASLIEAPTSSVALLSSVSAAASQVAECLPFEPGANLVLGGEEFRSNLFPWMNQERRGFELRLVPFRDGRLPAEDVAAAVDSKTALVAVSHVQSANGYRIDLDTLRDACRLNGARLFVDATQSLGALRLPLEGIDFVAAGAYKWMLSPRGASFLYVSPDRLAEQVPLQPSWKTPEDPHASYYGLPFESADGASKLDGSLAWPVWPGTARALELVASVGVDAIEARDLELARMFREGLKGVGLTPLFSEHESSQVVGLEVPDAALLERALDRENVVAAVRGKYLRVSFHFYNDESDVERCLRALESAAPAPGRTPRQEP